jgi:hypothetical protein
MKPLTLVFQLLNIVKGTKLLYNALTMFEGKLMKAFTYVIRLENIVNKTRLVRIAFISLRANSR